MTTRAQLYPVTAPRGRMASVRRSLLLALALQAAPIGAAFSQSPPPRTLSLQVDNDAFDFWMEPYNRPDDEYTSGVRLSWDGGSAPWWSRALFRQGDECAMRSTRCRTARVELGQDIFTPATSVDQPQAAPNSRPSAGWLYLSQTARQLAPARADEATITLGVTGPPSLAEQMQRFFHSLAPDYNRPADWNRQIAFEPGVVLRYEHRERLAAAEIGSLGVDLVPRVGVSAGNVLTDVDAGFDLRTGWHLPHPWLPSAGTSLTLTGGVTGRAVARDLFLDGNTFRDGPRVSREPFTGSGQLGLELRVGSVIAGYQAHSDSRTWTAGPKWHPWSSLVGGFTFDR